MGWTTSSGEDYYLVATKTLTNLPIPVILNAGVLSTKGYVRGVLGFGDDRDEAFFCNIETIPIANVIFGWEYAQGTDVGTDYSTDSMWDAHMAWMLNDFTLVASYATPAMKIFIQHSRLPSFGDGWVISAQYAF